MALSESPAIEDLRLLMSVAETGNVTQTAKLFGVSQPSVTKRLDVFRGDEPLVTTGGSSIQLTAKGHSVLPSVRELVRQYDQLKSCIAAKREASSVLYVATGSSASQHFLPAAIAQLRSQLPDLEIEVQATRGGERIAGVCEGRYDLAIVSHDRLQIDVAQSAYRRSQPELVIHELARQPLCLIAARASPAADFLSTLLAGQAVPLEMLTRWPLIGLDRSSSIRRQIERAFAGGADRLRFGLNAAGWLAVKEYAKHGLGVGVLPLALLTREDGDELVVRHLPPELSVNHRIIYRQDAGSRYLDELKTALTGAAERHEVDLRRRWNLPT